LKRKNGDVFQWDLWQTGMGTVDFTNPEAVKWYIQCLENLFDAGVDAIKTDFGERIPSQDVAWFDKSVDPTRMHNYYAFVYNKVVFEALQKRYGRDQAVLFARSATAGTQRFPLVSLPKQPNYYQHPFPLPPLPTPSLAFYILICANEP